MKLLLDTHILVWAAMAPSHIGKSTSRRLEDPRTELWFSPLSLFEMIHLTRTGRLKHGDPRWWFPDFQKEFSLKEAPLTSEIAFAVSHFGLPHGDPIDNLLVATARVMKLTFCTADEKLLESGAVPVLPHR